MAFEMKEPKVQTVNPESELLSRYKWTLRNVWMTKGRTAPNKQPQGPPGQSKWP